ncbi:asparagine synthase (glutamine-hydrolyzing) [Pseudomarimonas salicorniae]|uniref:asparagine synthase (glutamine-hydrolyzing) n=1 Tax=Pseudomarimonas salicorniae TaxID=2933270 RepID=A0ABT0GIG9_9GAMM|nr:asparagine synthase (glutamine-hydrolyzing) [Lysobacter sp. CAU 1642]MCK7593984.1 asparagine synthase (glutamine-hydrolyzing) [Lysobacter sp. CAU 1642]
MCGIIGVVGDGRREVPSAEVGEAMNAAIIHRGPDDGGLHRERDALLGMRRLAIIDLAGGHQPMLSDDGRVVLVFNGEIYNFRRLRRELEALGQRFRTDSDSEVILAAYLAWGRDAVQRLEGMFAFAIWDGRERRLLLARDRLGKKPLFVREHDGQLAFASELKSLLALPGFRREVDLGVLPAYFAFGYVPTPRSVFQGVHKLPPGHYAEFDAGGYRQHRYWRPTSTPVFTGSEAEAEERLAGLLHEAVADRLVADVPFGAFLSGGLDSSVVVALMARQMSRPVKTFSIGFREARYSELSDARRVATHLATEHHELVVEPDATAMVERLVWHLDEPFADASALPTYLVSELAAREVKMVLSGDGGDEAFAGYDRYLRLLALERLGALRGPAALALRIGGRLLPGRHGFRLRRIGERLGLGLADRYLSGVALSRPEQTIALIGEAGREGYASLHPLFHRGDVRPLLDRIVEVDLHSYLPDDILVKLDRMSMAASLEGRAPLLDHRVVEFALRLPVGLRVRDGRGKHLLRQVARRWLPAEVLDKPKQGFGIPLDEWFRGPLGGMAADLFASRAFRERGWVHPAAAEDLLARHRGGGENHAESLWQLLCLELWARRFIDGAGGG